MRKNLFVVAAVLAACGFTAFGETITDTTGYITLTTADVASQTSSFIGGAHWSDGQPPHDDADYLVQGAKQFRTDNVPNGSVFGGRSLSLDNGYLNLKVTGATFTIDDLRLYNASRIWNGNDNSTQKIVGKMTVFGTEANPPLIGLTQNSRNIIISGELVGDEDAVLKIGQNPGDGTLSSSNPCYALLNATNENGNADSYHGRFFCANRYAYLVVKTVKTLGSGDTQTYGSVIKLSGGGGLMGEAGLIFTNSAYSITINGVGRLGSYSAGPTNNELPLGGSTAGLYLGGGLEIKGENGSATLEVWNKSGAIAFNDVRFTNISKIQTAQGPVRFLEDYNHPDLPVFLCTGNTALAGWCENIGPVTLGASCPLSPGVGTKSVGTLGMESLTMSNGTFIISSLYQLEDGSVTSDLIRVKGNLTKGTNPIEIQFDCFPSGTNGVVKGKLLTAANLGTGGGITTNDFTWRIQDASLNNIVTGELSIEQDADGTNYLYFTRTCNMPVYLTGQDSSNSGGSSFDRGTHWDNQAAPDPEHDYIVPKDQLLRCYINATAFKGKSLTIQGGGDFSICGVTALVNDLRAYPGSRFSTRVNGTANKLLGNLTVYATKSSPADFMIESSGGSRQLTLGARLVGGNDAMVRFRCYTKGPGVGSDTFTGGKFVINGDNSAYKGKITIHQKNIVAEFANEVALGGPADAFAADRLILSSNSTFYCNSTYTLSEPTRGITVVPPDKASNYSDGGGNFQVTEGNTLTIQNVITGAGSLRKSGPGTLVLDATNTISGIIQPQEGKLAVRNPYALGTGKVKAFEPGILRVETAEGVTLAPVSPIDTSAFATLNVELAAFDAPTGTKIEANIFTLKTAATFDTSLLQLVNSGLGGNYKTEVFTRETEAGLQVYAVATPGGMVISIR